MEVFETLVGMQSVNSLEEFKEILGHHELETSTKYIFWKGDKAFSSQIESFAATPRMQIHWDGTVPYIFVGARTYLCHQGKDINIYQKKKYAEIRDNKIFSEDAIVKRRNLVQATKKVGCPARIRVARVIEFPQQQVSSVTKSNKLKAAKAIRDMLSNGEQLVGELKFLFRLPDICQHKFHTRAFIRRPAKKRKVPSNSSLEGNSCILETTSDTDNASPLNDKERDVTVSGKRKRDASAKTKKIMDMCNSHMKHLKLSLPLLEEDRLIQLEKQLSYLLQTVHSNQSD